ncbi:hypothetical protein AWC38_SpisGene10718 [Stylophora pistillata]|uniref:RNA-directed DNA polymerase from mobile element jockey n=1 Tax=Stylophora pistillata TaxID=50429 RepID=A0A2B4S7V4_STYPI|nr:hypothetical protein AWC38_SpisGene10718 [Stylophora pistillata]
MWGNVTAKKLQAPRFHVLRKGVLMSTVLTTNLSAISTSASARTNFTGKCSMIILDGNGRRNAPLLKQKYQRPKRPPVVLPTTAPTAPTVYLVAGPSRQGSAPGLQNGNRLQKRSKPLPVGPEDRIHHLIRENQRQAVKQDSRMSGRGSCGWWSTVNTITGRDTQPQLISSVIHPDIINKYLCSINSDPEYIAPAPIDIPDDARIPTIPPHVVQLFLSKLKRTACGPDELPYWLFREFAHDLAPVVTDLFNSSLQQHKVPSSWKMADIKPIPQESPLTCCTQLRPISLTAIIMRLFE